MRNNLTAGTASIHVQGPVNVQGVPGPLSSSCITRRRQHGNHNLSRPPSTYKSRPGTYPEHLNSAHQSPPFPERVADLSPRSQRQSGQQTPIQLCLTRTGVLPHVLEVTRQPAPGNLAGCYDVGALFPRRTSSSVHLDHRPPLASTHSPMWCPRAPMFAVVRAGGYGEWLPQLAVEADS